MICLKKMAETFNRRNRVSVPEDPISANRPSTILRTKPDPAVYSDLEPATELNATMWSEGRQSAFKIEHHTLVAESI